MQRILHQMQCNGYTTTGVLGMNTCTMYVDVLANVTAIVITGRPSEVQSFQHHPWYRVECAHSSLEIQ